VLGLDEAFVIGNPAPRIPSAPAAALDDLSHADWLNPAPRTRPQQLLELVCKAVAAPLGGVGVIAADGKLREHWTVGMAGGVAADLGQSAAATALIHFLLRQPAPLHLTDFQPLRQQLGLPDVLCDIGPFLGVPLVYYGRPLGGFYLARRQGAPAFTPEDDQVVLPVREWLSQGDLFEEARLLGQLRLLTQVAQAAAGSRDLPTILHVALHELERHMPLYVSVVWILQDRKRSAPASDHAAPSVDQPEPATVLKLTAVNSVPRHRAENMGLSAGMRVELQHTPFTPCLHHGQAVYLDLVRSEQPRSALLETVCARGANSMFAVPLRTGQQTVGILQSICTRPAGFTNEQIQILYQVADLLGPAISNCQLFSRLRAAYEELRQTQAQLIKAEKMRALGEMASGMAHDFNNALCGALGFLELVLTDDKLDEGTRGNLQSARTCTLDAAETVRRVQDFARWQRKEFSVALVDLNDLVRQTMELARHKWENLKFAQGQPITVEVVTEATILVCASAAELREILTNLVFNGVDAMPQGGKLTVRTWSDSDNAYLAVSDTGIGISESVRHRLFEPFFTTKGERGNGLGLSVTFGIVQRYDGEISVESSVGKGTTFTVRLPQTQTGVANTPSTKNGHAPAPAAPPKAPAKPQARGISSSTPTGRKGLRVLVIEDEESIRRFLATALKHLGHVPSVAADATEGLALFGKEPFDVVLTDFGLPGMSGEEVARAIAGKSPATPVILLTGWSHQLREAGKPLEGVSRVLGKPVTLEALNGALVGVCKD
jgi:signal transduction histidine kinase/CheY-like chemotaxis protein